MGKLVSFFFLFLKVLSWVSSSTETLPFVAVIRLIFSRRLITASLCLPLWLDCFLPYGYVQEPKRVMALNLHTRRWVMRI